MITSRKKRTPLHRLQQLSSAQLAEKWLQYEDIFQTSNCRCGMSSEEEQGFCFWLFLKCCGGDETQATGPALHLANIGCAEPQKTILYEPANGTTDPCKRAGDEKFLYLSPCGPGVYVLLVQPSPFSSRDISRGAWRGFGRSSSFSSCPALTSLQLSVEPPFLWDPVARWWSQPLALVAKRACFIGQKITRWLRSDPSQQL